MLKYQQHKGDFLSMAETGQKTPLMINQHWFRYWPGVVRQEALTRPSVYPGLCRGMASLCYNELMHVQSHREYRMFLIAKEVTLNDMG